MKLNIGDFALRESYDCSGPMNCERKGCPEELNGLNNFYISLGDGFFMDVWLCGACARRFRKLVAGKKK